MTSVLVVAAAMMIPTAAQAQNSDASVSDQLRAAMDMIQRQQEQIDRQAAELQALRLRFDRSVAMAPQAGETSSDPQSGPPSVPVIAAAQGSAPGQPGTPASVQQAPIPLERVGQAPEDLDRPIELAVLESRGSVVTRKNQLTGEFQLDYARADRNRAVFRGIELVEAVLVGVFDINESRQDVVTASAGLRYGLTDRLEIGARLPFISRSDTSIVAPISGSTNNDAAATIDSSVDAQNFGDLELTARYQLIDGRNGSPFVIANLQGVLPTGTDPFAIPRDELGRAVRASTGAGFYGIAPSVTAILPSDPVVLFGTLGYTFNIGKDVDTRIPPVRISYVDPGDAISGSAGIGISFNQRTSINLGYAHTWAFGTRTRTSLLEPTPQQPGEIETTSRDLQIGRLLFGVTYRLTNRTSFNWSVEVGATEDATDLRTVLRLPLVLLTGN
ncbi:transporter [Croceicoccus sp. F390]|uniref:Transporter n=1 Tax=Croceicoccus esteveae TaxID=3075597 RepID=A0ABU2ZJ78_9SPHN|nr:transporter [Croceicoccus sp. F390]MDT0575624.1 transporter [Croceicoccus sp. F390]